MPNNAFELTVTQRGRTVRAAALLRGPVRNSGHGRPLN